MATDKLVTVDHLPDLAAPVIAAAVDPLQNQIDSISQGQVSGVIGFATLADLMSDLEHPAGTVAYVTNDSGPENNGTYRKIGAEGTGTWEQSSNDRVAVVEASVSAVASGLGHVERRSIGTYHPLAHGATLNPGATHPGLTREQMLSEVEAAVVDIQLYGADPADSYYIQRIRRNASSGGWQLLIHRASDNAQVTVYPSPLTSPETSDPHQVVRVPLALSTTGITGYAWIRYGALTPGVANDALNIPLAPTVVQAPLPRLSRLPVPSPGTLAAELEMHTARIIVIPDGAAGFQWDGTTFSWGGFVLVHPHFGGGRLRVAAGSVTMTDSYQVAYIDLSELAADVRISGRSDAPSSIVKVGQYHVSSPTQFRAEPLQVPLFVRANSSHQYPAVPLPGISGDAPTPGGEFDPFEVVLRIEGSDQVSVYVPIGSGRYAKWPLQRVVNNSDPRSDGGGNADSWNIVGGGQEVERSGLTSFTPIRELWPTGEWELALRLGDRIDFMGGHAHGDERISEPIRMYVDGVPVSSAGWYRGRGITAIVISDLYDPPYSAWSPGSYSPGQIVFHSGQYWEADSTTTGEPGVSGWTQITWSTSVLAKHRKRYEWTAEGLTLTQDVIWHTTPDTPIVAGYLAMLPVHREGVSGPAITTRALVHHQDYGEYDISSQGSEYSSASLIADRATLSGEAGVSFDVEVLDTSHADLAGPWLITRLSGRNKFYSRVRTPLQPSSGTHWRITSRYRITS